MPDVIVVGGGSAGCVLASRLSEDPSRRVLLLEAGPDFTGLSDLPPELVDASGPTDTYDWGYVAEPDAEGRHRALPRARVIGGCSATNGCFALRGSPADYDGWVALGNPGWSFAEVLPFFQRLETDADFQNAWHGLSGPIPIRRHPSSELNRVQAAFVQAAVASGMPLVADHNQPGMLGVGPMPRNARDGVRMSTAVTYLAGIRRRSNLVVRGNTLVDRVEVRQGVAAGVRLAGGAVLEADQVILAAGAYASPVLLMRSGIGPADQLLDLGIEVIVDLPGVGENLMDHPLVAVDLPVQPGWTGPRFQTMATWRSQRAPAAGAPDLHLFIAGPFDVPRHVSPTGAIFGLVTGLVLPFSRGWVRLRSADPGDPPRIDPAHLRDPRDMPRMLEATLLARAISRTQPLAGLIEGPEINPGAAIADADAQGIQASIAIRVSSYHHPVGTCRMGPSPEEGAVVDARGAVYGVERLCVVDASIMPTIPAANTNLPTIMVAERVASWMTTGGVVAPASASESDRTLPGV